MPHLLEISIGPVQDFIAAARKTRDLWFGSAMLSEVARAVAVALDEAGAALVFPDPEALGGAGAVANKVLAVVETGDPPALVALARAAAKRQLVAFRDEVVRHLPLGGREVRLDLLDLQLADFLEIAAAWTHFDGPSGYAVARRDAERLLAGRKALRDFGPAAGAAGVPKSSLDPSRESVVLKDGRARLGLGPGEELDGVSLIKRRAETRRFVSVSRVAQDPFIRRAERDRPEVLDHLRQLARRLERSGAAVRFGADREGRLEQYAAFPYDTDLFYDDGRGDDRLTSPEDAATASHFYRAVRGLGLGEPPAYCAVLVADGDRMGKLVAALATPELHRALSGALGEFARRAEEVVSRRQGALVYSGGDDVLAFLPLDTALPCADDLRRAFVETVGPASGQGGPSVSLSVGLAIGHIQEPLRNLLQWGREAEQVAKLTRNALAVALHTRGGGAVTVADAWDADPVRDRWGRWITWHVEDAIPDGAAYELRALAGELRALGRGGAELGDVLRGEVERVLRRKRSGRGTARLEQEVLDPLMACLGAGDPLVELKRLVDGLIVARRIATVVGLANGRSARAEVGHGD